ncbi:E2F-associated phosphoprotein [Armadillidium nasatum]|uniref:E2F-associated phosphoprotein n=1 Tax=Armadillidium nasatum TaxID=96803 RepID=A0A5N5SK76_9CRUS|nr:E2F-associated phosphoprotein [Armadillidium nasatum]
MIKDFDDDDDSDEEENEMDEFEKEMAAELNATMEKIMAPYTSKPSTSGEDDDSPPTSNKRKDKHKVIPNDDLFYDPLMDEEDQAWVDNNRRKYQLRSKKLTKDGKIKPQALPHSDAVLNCPACFSTLCHDCQRHEIYKNQYRAMFVFNCVVDKSERLHFAIKEDKKKKFKKGKKRKLKSIEEESSKLEDCEEKSSTQDTNRNPDCEKTSSTQDTNQNPECKDEKDEIFYPVMCALCNTKIAVQDEDEVYHFFNVLTSY